MLSGSHKVRKASGEPDFFVKFAVPNSSGHPAPPWHIDDIQSKNSILLIEPTHRMETRKIKLIWDFRGPTAHSVARHHEEHLKEYIAASENLSLDITGHSDLSDLHSLTFIVVEESEMPAVRDALRPHRGEIYED